MGFSKGTSIIEAIIENSQEYIPDETDRGSFYTNMIETVLDLDWDAYDEVRGLDDVFDSVLDDILSERGLLDDDYSDD